MRSALLIGALIGHLALTQAVPLQPVSGLTQWQNDILDNILTRYGITDVKQLASLDPNALQSVNAEATAAGLTPSALDSVKSAAGIASSTTSAANPSTTDATMTDMPTSTASPTGDSSFDQTAEGLGMSRDALIGMICGCVIGGILVFAFLYWVVTRKNKSAKNVLRRENEESSYYEVATQSGSATPKRQSDQDMLTPTSVNSALGHSTSPSRSNSDASSSGTPPVQPRLLSASKVEDDKRLFRNPNIQRLSDEQRRLTFSPSPLRNEQSAHSSYVGSMMSETETVITRPDSNATLASEPPMAGPKPPSPVGSIKRHSPIAPGSPPPAIAKGRPISDNRMSRVTFGDDERVSQVTLTPRQLR